MRPYLIGVAASLVLQACATTESPAPAAKAAATPAAQPTAAAPATPPPGLPADALWDGTKKNHTVFPVPKPNSGELKTGEHPRDLGKWLTRSHLDTRSAPKPKKVTLEGPLNGDPAKGKEVAMDTARGNCWACHALPGDPQPGNSGPSLIGFKSRGYSDADVYQYVYDRRVINPATAMPPFGTFGTLSDQEIRDIVAYLQSLK